MLTFFLMETILWLRAKMPGLYSQLFSELMSKGLISNSDRLVPNPSNGIKWLAKKSREQLTTWNLNAGRALKSLLVC